MKIRSVLTLTGVASAILGAIVAYLVLSVPNDLRADGLLKEARQQITDGENEKARDSLSKILQQYPRTDAAAAANVALLSMATREREDLSRAVTVLRRQNEEQARLIADLQKNVTKLKTAPPPPAPAPVVGPPAPKPAAKNVAAKKQTTPKKTTKKKPTTRRRR